MYKQSPSGRMNRSRGFKVKNVLQICVLLAVCLWLVYQVKQSHEKKEQFDGNESSLSQKTGSSSDGGPNLGRKYPPDSKRIANSDNNLEDDEDLEERDREKNDGEVEREDEAVGNEKESEERDSDGNNGEGQDGNSEDSENDEDSGSKHEAQEVLYKADDASSAVTHDTQEVITTENENAEVNVLEQAGEGNNVNEISDGQDRTTRHEESEHFSNSQGTSPANVTSTEGLNGHPMERNLTEKTREANNNVTSSENEDSALKNEDLESNQTDSSAESNHAKSSVSEKVIHGHPRFTTEDDRWSTTIDTLNTVDETGSAEEEFESFNTENIGEIEDLIDSSDSSVSLDEKDVRNDPETLPEIQTEGSNTEDPAAK